MQFTMRDLICSNNDNVYIYPQIQFKLDSNLNIFSLSFNMFSINLLKETCMLASSQLNNQMNNSFDVHDSKFLNL